MPTRCAPHTSSKSRSPTKTQRDGLGDADGLHRRQEGLGCGLRPRHLAGVDGAVDEVQDPVAGEELLVPGARPDRVGQHPHLDAVGAEPGEQLGRLGIGEGVRGPELAVGGEQPFVVGQPRLLEDVLERGAGVGLLRPSPHGTGGLVQGAVRLGVGVDRGGGQCLRLGLHVDGVPGREGAAPVEDHRLDLTHGPPSRRARRRRRPPRPPGRPSPGP